MKRALIIAGEQGSGRTSRARVEAHGRYVETNYRQLSEPFGFGVVFGSEPDTVIVDDMPDDPVAWQTAKAIVCEESILVNEKYKTPRYIDISKMNFIFCTGAKNPLLVDLEDRRFEVIRL